MRMTIYNYKYFLLLICSVAFIIGVFTACPKANVVDNSVKTQRIISLAPNITEIVYALDKEAELTEV